MGQMLLDSPSYTFDYEPKSNIFLNQFSIVFLNNHFLQWWIPTSQMFHNHKEDKI